MVVTNAGKRRKSTLKTFIMLASKMVLKTKKEMNLQREQDSSQEEMMVILNLLPPQLQLELTTGTLRDCWALLMALDLRLNLPSIRQVEITSSTWLATLLTP